MLSSFDVFSNALTNSFFELTFVWFIGVSIVGAFLGLLPVMLLAFLKWPLRTVSQ